MQGEIYAQKPTRIVWVDLLRLIAIFMVICIHCADPFNVSPEARSNPDYNFWGSLYGSFLRPCVPLFVMITGLLLLPVKMSIGDFYKKRLLRIAVPFLVWSVLYNLFPWFIGVLGLPATTVSNVFAYAGSDVSLSFSDAFKNILLIPFQFNVYTVPMWYIYMLIGLYLYMPFFSVWVEKCPLIQKRIFLFIWGITLFMPYVYQFYSHDVFGMCAWNSFSTFYYFSGVNGYLLLGHYLVKDVKEWSWSKTTALSIALFAVGYIATYLGFKYMTANPNCTEPEMELFFLYCTPNVALMTFALFIFVRKIKIERSWVIKALANLTKCGLGIYLIHYFVVGLGYTIADALAIPISIRIPITALIALSISWAFVASLFAVLPKVSKWIFG